MGKTQLRHEHISMEYKTILQCPICLKVIGMIGSGCSCDMFKILEKYHMLLAEMQIELQQCHGQINILRDQLEEAEKEIETMQKQISKERFDKYKMYIGGTTDDSKKG